MNRYITFANFRSSLKSIPISDEAFDGAVLILHGEVDHLVPAEHARRLHQAATRASERPEKRWGPATWRSNQVGK